MLGPRSFVSYAEDVTDVFSHHRVSHQLFADDMQGMCHAKSFKVADAVARLESCTSDVCSWCSSKGLQLNTSKTESLLFGSASSLSKVSDGDKILHIGNDTIQPSDSVRDLGVFLDSHLT